MNDDIAIRLQTYVDGEMAGAEKVEMETQLARDPELQALAGELNMVTRALRESDPLVSVPETREFYWSQVQRRIAAEEASAQRPVSTASAGLAAWLRRSVLPLSGLAAACLMLMTTLRSGSPVSSHEDTESPLNETGALTFRSESQKVTVVWLYDKEQASLDIPAETVN